MLPNLKSASIALDISPSVGWRSISAFWRGRRNRKECAMPERLLRNIFRAASSQAPQVLFFEWETPTDPSGTNAAAYRQTLASAVSSTLAWCGPTRAQHSDGTPQQLRGRDHIRPSQRLQKCLPEWRLAAVSLSQQWQLRHVVERRQLRQRRLVPAASVHSREIRLSAAARLR